MTADARGAELVPLQTDTCIRCGASLIRTEIRQDALLRHGGYGGTCRTDTDICSECSYVRVVAISTERPPR